MERYLGPGEHVLYATRRHSVVLDPAVAVWLGGVVVALVLSLAAPGHPGRHLGQVGSVVFVAGSAFLAWRTWQWSAARYVVTNERVLFIQGIVARQVNGVPLGGVLDTTYRRTLAGRLRGYGALELNISGTPGLRTLMPLRHPDAFYQLILSLTQHPAVLREPANIFRPSDGFFSQPQGAALSSDWSSDWPLLSPGAVRA